jgi:hypothetical protein
MVVVVVLVVRLQRLLRWRPQRLLRWRPQRLLRWGPAVQAAACPLLQLLQLLQPVQVTACWLQLWWGTGCNVLLLLLLLQHSYLRLASLLVAFGQRGARDPQELAQLGTIHTQSCRITPPFSLEARHLLLQHLDQPIQLLLLLLLLLLLMGGLHCGSTTTLTCRKGLCNAHCWRWARIGHCSRTIHCWVLGAHPTKANSGISHCHTMVMAHSCHIACVIGMGHVTMLVHSWLDAHCP